MLAKFAHGLYTCFEVTRVTWAAWEEPLVQHDKLQMLMKLLTSPSADVAAGSMAVIRWIWPSIIWMGASGRQLIQHGIIPALVQLISAIPGRDSNIRGSHRIWAYAIRTLHLLQLAAGFELGADIRYLACLSFFGMEDVQRVRPDMDLSRSIPAACEDSSESSSWLLNAAQPQDDQAIACLIGLCRSSKPCIQAQAVMLLACFFLTHNIHGHLHDPANGGDSSSVRRFVETLQESSNCAAVLTAVKAARVIISEKVK